MPECRDYDSCELPLSLVLLIPSAGIDPCPTQETRQTGVAERPHRGTDRRARHPLPGRKGTHGSAWPGFPQAWEAIQRPTAARRRTREFAAAWLLDELNFKRRVQWDGAIPRVDEVRTTQDLREQYGTCQVVTSEKSGAS